MTRTEFSSSVRKKQTCFRCNAKFTRHYNLSVRRAALMQFCGAQCRAAYRRAQAEDLVAARFWEHVDKRGPDECWVWKGRLHAKGYGVLDVGGRPVLASRLSYRLHNGLDAGTLFVCHSCDNPPCCNPNHLWLGTQKQNMHDASVKGRTRNSGVKGEEHPCARLSEFDVANIRSSDRSNRVLGVEYGVTTANIYNIRKRKTWRHV